MRLFLIVFASFSGWASLLAGGEIKPLSQEAYVWQRAWSEEVRESILAHAGAFTRLVLLNAEVTWSSSQPRAIRVTLDYATLRASHSSIGLALRVGQFPGPFKGSGEPIDSLARLASSLVTEAASNGVHAAELQIDFDCAASKLTGFQTWLEVIRKKIAPTPLTITALPSWVEEHSFKKLITSTDGYVLQVHSLERPQNSSARLILCDADLARRAAERAGRFTVPFRVALPTYGYLVAFDKQEFIGLSAEGPSPSWPAGTFIREVCADPNGMARLIQTWTKDHPSSLSGVIWYRLPIRSDMLNWHWSTLAAVMAGREPAGRLRVQAQATGPGLFEVVIANEGETNMPLPDEVVVHWRQGHLVAGDGLRGFELTDQKDKASSHFLHRAGIHVLPPGTTIQIGWLRLSQSEEVTAEAISTERNGQITTQ